MQCFRSAGLEHVRPHTHTSAWECTRQSAQVSGWSSCEATRGITAQRNKIAKVFVAVFHSMLHLSYHKAASRWTLAVRSEEAWQAGDVSERHGSILCISESLQQLFFESCKVAFLHGFAEQVTDGDGMMTLADLRMGRLETPSTLCSLLFSIKPKETRRRCSLVEWCGMLPSYSTHQSNWCLHLYPTMGMYIDSLSRPL